MNKPDSPALPPHLTETTARPRAPHPRRLTRDLRSSTLACHSLDLTVILRRGSTTETAYYGDGRPDRY